MKNNNKGFTLIEVLIAMSIFTILIAIGIGGFVHTLHIQREIASFISVQDNTSLALEQMTREIRTGYLFCKDPGGTAPNGTCFSACTVSGPPATPTWTCTGLLDFKNGNGDTVDYRDTGGTLTRSLDGATPVPITSNTVQIKYLTFTIFGNLEGDNWNPRITISMGVFASSTDPVLMNDVLNLQTSVSAREIDCTATDPVQC
jgi:prepilin-type N-terminal cleavage/methylation domain-containing protein